MSSRWWRDDALCGLGTARLFEPPHAGEARTFPDRWTTATAICARCPVAAECLTEAIAAEDSGIFAGLLLADGRPVDWRSPGRRLLSVECAAVA